MTTAYEEIKRGPKLGEAYEADGSDLEIWTKQLETGHMLYFTLVSRPPLATFIRVIGVKGPGEAEPFFAR